MIKTAAIVVITLSAVLVLQALRQYFAGQRKINAFELGPYIIVQIVVSSSVALQTSMLANNATLQAVLLLVVLLGLAFTCIRVRGSSIAGAARLPFAGVAAAGFWMWLLVIDILNNSLAPLVLLARIGAGILIIVLTWTASRRTIYGSYFAASLAITLATIAALSPFTPNVWRPCDQFKCNFTGGLFRGPFASENYLAMQCVFLVLLALAFLPSVLRWKVVLLGAVVIAAAGSRTSLLVVLVVALAGRLVLLSGRQKLRDHRERHFDPIPSRPSTGFAWLLLTLASLAIALFLVLTASPTRFSNRGEIWIRGLQGFEGHRLFGVGIDRWKTLQLAGLVPEHFPHNVYLLMWFSGGAIGLGLMTIWLTAALTRLSRVESELVSPVVLAIALMFIGFTEVVWNPMTFDGLSWIALAISVIAKTPSYRGRGRTRAGLPVAIEKDGMSFATTAPAPTIVPRPIVTPGRMMARAPIHTSSEM